MARQAKPAVPSGTFGDGSPPSEPSGASGSDERAIRSALRPPPPADDVMPLRLSDVEPVELDELLDDLEDRPTTPGAPSSPGPASDRYLKGSHPQTGAGAGLPVHETKSPSKDGEPHEDADKYVEEELEEELALGLDDLVASFELPPVPPAHVPQPDPGTEQERAATKALAKLPPLPPLPEMEPVKAPEPKESDERAGFWHWSPVLLGVLLLGAAAAVAVDRWRPTAPASTSSASTRATGMAVDPAEPVPPAPASDESDDPAATVPPESGEPSGAVAEGDRPNPSPDEGTDGVDGAPSKVAGDVPAAPQADGRAGAKPVVKRRVRRTRPKKPAAAAGESLTRAEIVRGFTSVNDGVQACASGQRGVANVTATIAGSGRVSYALVTGQFHGTPEGSCVARAVRKARFPAFTGEALKVEYPFPLR